MCYKLAYSLKGDIETKVKVEARFETKTGRQEFLADSEKFVEEYEKSVRRNIYYFIFYYVMIRSFIFFGGGGGFVELYKSNKIVGF